jgi:hypothetical protein
MLLQLGFLQHEPKIQKAPVENESLSWYFVSSLRGLKPPVFFKLRCGAAKAAPFQNKLRAKFFIPL